MALSVLVALMMLAVPLASSSNLFVDGGQTNSNGDAPTLGADADVQIIETWIIDDAKSYDKLSDEMKNQLAGGQTWDKMNATGVTNDFPWLVIKFTLPNNPDATKVGLKIDNPNIPNGSKTFGSTLAMNETVAGVTYYYKTLSLGKQNVDPNSVDFLGLDDNNYVGTYTVSLTGDSSATTPVYVKDSITYTNDGYKVTFDLNAPNADDRISLDKVITSISKTLAGVTWYTDPVTGEFYAIVPGNIHINELVGVLTVEKEGYNFEGWKDSKGNAYSSTSPTDLIDSNLTLIADWSANENWAQIPIDVKFDGSIYKYIKSYLLNIDNSTKESNGTVSVNTLTLVSLLPSEINDEGYIINIETPTTDSVYSYVVSDSIKGDITDKTVDIVAKNNIISVDYSLTTYTKISVSSTIFGEEKAIMYAYNSNDYTYNQIWTALKTVDGKTLKLTKNFGSADSKVALDIIGTTKVTTADGKYKITSWDNEIALDDTKTDVGTELVLNSELNSYNVIFMVNGKAQIVNIQYGQLTVDKCPFDITGINHWVYLDYNSYRSISETTSFAQFNFNSQGDISKVDNNTASDDTPVAVFIACFEKVENTAYAVFKADSGNIVGDFGNEFIKSIIIPGKASADGSKKTLIPLPSSVPVYETKNIFTGYTDYYAVETTAGEDSTIPASTYGAKDDIKAFSANVVPYLYEITFYDGSDISGVFYYNGVITDLTSLVAFVSEGMAYEYPTGGYDKLNDNAKKAFNNVLYPAKDGYKVTQWKDADGNVMLDKVKPVYDKDGKLTGIEYSVKFNKISSDMNFYANFEAEDYIIIYAGNTATATNTMVQYGKVGESLKLFGDSTFKNEGYTLKEWNTRPDGKGTSYALGSDFTLSGEQYEDLVEITHEGTTQPGFMLYAIWDSVGGSGSGSGSSGDNGDDNTNTYLLAGILIVIIILIIVVAVILRKK